MPLESAADLNAYVDIQQQVMVLLLHFIEVTSGSLWDARRLGFVDDLV